MSKLPLLALVILALAACGGSRAGTPIYDTLQQVKAANVLRVGVKADTPPFGFKRGGELAGFDIDLAYALAQELGIKDVAFVTVTSADRIQKLNAGEVDCLIASMTITRAREHEVDFTIPYFMDGQALLVKADAPIRSYQDLAGRKVGAVRGSTSGSNMQQVAPDCQVVQLGGFPDLLKALDAGSVDAITSDSLILTALMRNSGKADAYRIAGDRFSTEPYGIALRQNQSPWRDAVNEAVQKLWENGRWQLIYDTWFGPRSKYATETTFSITPFPR
jgi:polar amino acid transport system substrate-binding protein